jgi:siroheme synthase
VNYNRWDDARRVYMDGKILIVGFGPGSFEYITLRAREVIQESQVIVGNNIRRLNSKPLGLVQQPAPRVHCLPLSSTSC